MSKKTLLQEIDEKVAKKKALREEIASRKNNIEEYVVKFIGDLEDMIANSANTDMVVSLCHLYIKGFERQVRALDPECDVDVMWLDRVDDVPQVNGILIKWSADYQQKNNCDAELFVDVASVLFK